jgi:hypothetical protein
MRLGGLSLCVVGTLLAGCVADSGIAAGGGVRTGYVYHDGNHPNETSVTSPQALYNATHGTWLWGPANNVMND